MSHLSERVAFLQGLAQGMELKEDTAEHKLLLKIIETFEAVADELDELQESHDELSDYVEEIDEDLADVVELLSDEEDEDEDDEEDDHCSCCGGDVGDDEEDDDDESGIVEYECPHCGYMTRFDVADFDLEEDYRCPSCHQPLFPETDDDESDEDEAEEDVQDT